MQNHDKMGKKIVFICGSPYGGYKISEKGEVDGYVMGGDGVPRAVVVKESGRFVTASLDHIREDNGVQGGNTEGK